MTKIFTNEFYSSLDSPMLSSTERYPDDVKTQLSGDDGSIGEPNEDRSEIFSSNGE